MSDENFDASILAIARNHLNQFIDRNASVMDDTGTMLEIGPEGRTYVQECFPGWKIDSLDIVPSNNPTYVGDITVKNEAIKNHSYDAVACLEVLEHTLNPFGAIDELKRILKPDGILLISAPLNFRIHGPIPDCWRFTEFGWRVLLKDFEILEFDVLETPGRDLFPIKYNIRAKHILGRNVPLNELTFQKI
jgi:SAM-dependent methyltransferase